MSNLTRGTVRDSLSVAITVVAYGGAAASAIAAATMLGTRNALYGIQMAPQLKVKGARRVLAAHITIDESTGVALSQAPRGVAAMREGFWITGSGVFVFWNIFTLLGALGAKALGNPASWGLDAGLPSALAPSAPSSVKMFQKTKTPDPVIQKPSRIAATPRGAWESATPVDSSMVMCAAAQGEG